jgi:hypothetical protein
MELAVTLFDRAYEPGGAIHFYFTASSTIQYFRGIET